MKKETKIVGVISISLIILSILMTISGVYIYDGTRDNSKYTVPIPDGSDGDLVYYEWEPVEGAPDRDGKVVFCFAGFLAQQTMMYPMMREFTKQGYHVVTGDFRGHGESGGTFTMDWNVLLDDFNAMFDDIKLRHQGDDWNLTHVAVCGHSMGGFASILIGHNVEEVFTTVAFAPAPYKGNINATDPKNLLILVGSGDQAFTEEVTLELFQEAVPNGEAGKLYGDPLEGTAKKLVIARWARHENELTDDYCLSQAVTFVEMGFGYMNPGDDFLANQQYRVGLIEIAMIVGLIGLSILFFVSNQIELKRPENEVLGKIFDQIVGILDPEEWEKLLGLRKLREIHKENTNRKLTDEELEDINLQYTKQKNPVKLFFKDWFIAYLPSVILGFAFLGLSLFVIKDVFSNMQILLLSTPGICNIFVAYQNYRREKESHKNFTQYLKPLTHQFKREFSGKSFWLGLSFYALSMFIILFGFGQTYMFLFPMNQRIYNLFILIPFIFLMYLAQSVGYIYHLVERLRGQKYGFWKALGVVLITKHFAVYVVGIVMLIALNNSFITIFLMLILVDLLATGLLLINYWFNKNYGSIIIWATLLVSTIYLGYAGVINGWEVLFGQEYNAFYWIG